MSKNLVCDILAYLDYLKGLGLSVSIHDNGCRLPLFTEDLFPYVIHSNPYCMLVKSQKRALDQCLSCQKRVLRKCQKGAFRGMCFAGVEELIFPVGDENPLGFVCVSGYRVQRKKAQKRICSAAAAYGFDAAALSQSYDDGLKDTMPDMKAVSVIIQPLCHMMELLFSATNPVHVCWNNADYVFRHIIAYIRQNYRSSVTLDDISSFCHYSHSYISHLFQSRTGYNLNRYINRLRIEEAKRYLKETSLPVGEIAGKIGFSDANYFSNTFRRCCGCSPRAFRAASGQTNNNGNN